MDHEKGPNILTACGTITSTRVKINASCVRKHNLRPASRISSEDAA